MVDSIKLTKRNKVRLEGATDLAEMVAERNPVVRTATDAYDALSALDKIRTGQRRRSPLEKLQSL